VTAPFALVTEERTADVSPDRRYRYSFVWRWASGPRALVVGINPSDGDTHEPDATMRKWRGFCGRLGFGSYEAVNPYALRSPDPSALLSCDLATAIGRLNDAAIAVALDRCDEVIACWGRVPAKALQPRIDEVRDVPMKSGKRVRCWGYTADRQPRHPLMLAYDTPLEDLRP
jgi:hypothetical protein